MWNPQTHGTTGSWDGGDDNHSAGLAAGKRTRTQDLLHKKQTSAATNLRQSSEHASDHEDPFSLHFGGIDFLGIKLSGNSSADDFRAVEHKLGDSKQAQFRAAADKGPDALLALFIANGVVVDEHNRADALAVADAYIRYVETSAHQLSPGGLLGKAEGEGGGKSGDAGSLEELSYQVGRWGIETELGHYFEVELDAHIPTEIPDLFVDLGGKLGFTKKANGAQELEIELGTGVSFDAFSFLEVSQRRFVSIKLEAGKGESFADAFEDAIKQSVRAILIDTGVEQQLLELKRMALEGSTTKDWLLAFGHAITTIWSGKVELAERAIATVGGDRVVQVVDAYLAFFKDNTHTGFDISIHQEQSVKLGVEGDSGFKLDMGIGVSEDVGDTEAHVYGEVGGRATIDPGGHGPSFSLFGKCHLDHEGPHFTVGFEVEAPWNGTDLFAAAGLLALCPGFRNALGTLTGNGPSDQNGFEAALDLFGAALGEAILSTFAGAFGFEHTMSLSVEYTFGPGGTEDVKATARSKTEAELDEKVFKAKASMGSFIDVTAAYKEAVPKSLH